MIFTLPSILRPLYAKLLSTLTYSSPRPSLTTTAICAMSTIPPPRDRSTLSNYNYFRTTHTTTNFNISFSNQKLVGNVVLTLKSITDAQTKEIVLDSSYLDISNVKVDGKTAKWEILPRTGPLGSPLKIQLDDWIENGKSVDVDVGFPSSEI
jgi:leukotriene-A4 hydrolase